MTRRRPRSGDRGAILVETALVSLFLVIMLVGVTEYGFAWRQGTVTDKATQAAGRAAGNGADNRFADYEALHALQASMGSARNVTVDRIVVFKSTSAAGSMDQDCLTASKNDVCNRYVAGDLSRPAGQFGCGGSSPDRFWCPTGRNRDRTPSSDYVGVHVTATYSGLTGLVPGGITITRTAIYALEPCAFGIPDC